MNSKSPYNISSSPSSIRKRFKSLKSQECAMDIDEMLFLASKKLNPVIETLVKESKNSEQYLSTEEYEDAIIASRIVKDITKALKLANIQTNIREFEFQLENYDVALNHTGKIYVETVLLIQLIDLYNILEDIKDVIDYYDKCCGVNSFVQTESIYSIPSNDEIKNPNKIVLKLSKPLSESNNFLHLLQRDFIVLPSSTNINEVENPEENFISLNESQSQVLTRDDTDPESSTPRKAKSAGSLGQEEFFEVTDVYGAKKVLVKCICDLEKLREYLDIERKDATTICSMVEVDNISSTSKKRRTSFKTSDGTNNTGMGQVQETHGDRQCCCSDTCIADLEGATNENLNECDEDKVIICIKGRDEEEGDVQIVIRQCPDCKKIENPLKSQSDKSIGPSQSKPDESQAERDTEILSKPKSNSTIKSVRQSKPKEPPSTVMEKTDEITSKNSEPYSLHNKDSQGSYVCSEESDDEKKLIDVYKPKDSADKKPRREPSTVKPSDPVSSTPTQSFIQNEVRVSCSRLKFYETTNLCLQTETGEELVISLTVTPKAFAKSKLSIRDIFSEDEYAKESPVKYDDDDNEGKSDAIPPEKKSIHSEGKKSDKLSSSDKDMDEFDVNFEEDHVIPLTRTKMCSSLEFDVTTADSKIREQGIQNKNPNIIVQLKEFGVDNLLRACRPAKCCRKAILNEKMKKCLPYPPSLRSLPLDESDMEVINQSLQMSLQKVKNSMNLKKDFYTTQAIYMNPVHTIMFCFVENKSSNRNVKLRCRSNDFVRKKLSYYINLANDLDIGTPSPIYRAMYFDVEQKLGKNFKNRIVKKYSQQESSNSFTKHQVDIEIVKVISNPFKWVKQKFHKHDEIPMLTGHNLLNQNEPHDFKIKSTKNLSEVSHQPTQTHIRSDATTQPEISNKKIKPPSRIPVLQKTKFFVKKSTISSNLPAEPEIYTISLQSLPKEQDIYNREEISSDLPPREIINHNDILLNYDQESCQKSAPDSKYSENYFKNILESSEASKYSVLSKPGTFASGRNKRKKKEFYMSRSRSDISLNTLKNIVKNKTRSKKNSKEKLTLKPVNGKKIEPDKEEAEEEENVGIMEDNTSKIILNYFTKLLYEMIMRNAVKDNKLKDVLKTSKRQSFCNVDVSTVDKNVLELFKRTSNTSDVSRKRTSNRTIKIQDSFSFSNGSFSEININKKPNNSYVLKNLALQTSILFRQSKQCQTSEIFSTYLIKPSPKAIRNKNSLQKNHRVFKKLYNQETLTGVPNSCDQMENFIVVFKSKQSFSSNVSDPRILSTYSMGSRTDQSISNSLLRLKQTLEEYENVKSQINSGALQKSSINPIEYFVYQMCACNSSKQPSVSVMQKIINKTKGLFSSVDKEICVKYRNQRQFLSTPSTDRNQLCHRCGCYISNCDEPKTNLSNFCKCKIGSPSVDKPTKQTNIPWGHIQNNQPKGSNKKPYDLSKIKSSSLASIKSLTTCFKNSLSSLLNRSKGQKVSLCACSKDKKNAETICVPENVSVVICTKKMKDSSTQKCQCQKCENFAEDGTCCCSHCLGCLDKSFVTKPDNNDIGTFCDCDDIVSKQGPIESGDDKTKAESNRVQENPENMAEKTQSPVTEDQAISKESKDSNKKELEPSTNITPSQDNPKTATETPKETVPVDMSLTMESNDSAHENTAIEVVNDDSGRNNDSAAYFFLTQPNMFQNFTNTTRNPFHEYLSGFPHQVNLFTIKNPTKFRDH